MVLARIDRKNNTPVDFLHSHYGRYFDVDILKAIHKMLGTRDSMKLLARCVAVEKHLDVSSVLRFGEASIPKDREKVFVRLTALKGLLIEHYLNQEGAEMVIRICIRQLEQLAELGLKMHISQGQIQAVEDDWLKFEPDVTKMSWWLCVYLAWSDNHSHKGLVIAYIKGYLAKGGLSDKVIADYDLSKSALAHLSHHEKKLFVFCNAIVDAVETCVGKSGRDEMVAKARFEQIKLDKSIRLYTPYLIPVCP